MPKSTYDMIHAKRMKEAHSENDLRTFLKAYLEKEIDDAQMASWLMAVCINGMTEEETFYMTDTILHSGDILTWNDTFLIDKHSSGGVGDKVSLISLPIVASLGVPVLKLSGRGLGHTGGTIDKLESIPNLSTNLDKTAILQQMQDINIYIGAQTGELAPLDKKLYALRSKTATVDSIPLIASSIISKKLASGANAFVFDIKIGQGAFLKSKEEGLKLVNVMANLLQHYKKNANFILSDMNQPLGKAVGNSVEIYEVINVLRNDADSDKRLKDLSIEIAANMYSLYANTDLNDSRLLCQEKLECGDALRKFNQMIQAQGGSLQKFFALETEFTYDFYAESNGIITNINAEKIGLAANRIGTSLYKNNDIDFNSGFVFDKKVGDRVFGGERILQIRYEMNRANELCDVIDILKEAILVEDIPENFIVNPVIIDLVKS